jgi:hypothetical protein
VKPAPKVFGYRTSFPALLVESLKTWCAASGEKISYELVNDPDKADICVSWTRDALPADSAHPYTHPAGVTFVHGFATADGDTASELIGSADIHLLTVDAFLTDRPVNEGALASTCMHEVGHALGLVGHSTCISDVMYFRASVKQSGQPTKRDRATIAKLYESYPVVATTPASILTPAPPLRLPTKFAPPPAFLPPAPPDTKTLPPPMFLPPPVTKDVLPPPLFTPPPLTKAEHEAPPLFTPPPISGSGQKQQPPLFLPPPASKVK